MSTCISGKRSFNTQEEGERALIENRIHFNHDIHTGPKNIYICSDCGNYHFTSRGELSQVVIDNQEYIKSQQRARSWEDKFKRY